MAHTAGAKNLGHLTDRWGREGKNTVPRCRRRGHRLVALTTFVTVTAHCQPYRTGMTGWLEIPAALH